MLSTILTFMLAWYNLPFTFLLAVCLLMAALQWIGLGGDHDPDSEAEGDLDHDLDGDFDHELDHDLDGDLDHDLEGHLDHDLDLGETGDVHSAGETAAELGFSILAYLGVGRAPLLVTLLLLFGSVGLTGWIFNGFAVRVLGTYPVPIMAAALAVSLGLGSLVSSRIARAIGRTLPPVSTTVTSAHAMVGRRGTVISPFVDQRYGMVHLRDAAGTLISVFAVTQAEQPIRRGEEVILINYDPEKHLYTVIHTSQPG